MNKTKALLLFAVLVLVGIFSRWIPHPPNFTALLAVAIYAGFVLPPLAALATPVLAAVLGDLWLGTHEGMWVVYLSLIALVFVGRVLTVPGKSPRRWLSWGLAGLSGSVVFYVTTNLFVWWSSGMYPHTADGLISCFVLAIPFFHNSVLSTWLFMGAFEAVRQLVPASKTVTA